MRDLMNRINVVPAFLPKVAVTDNTAQVSTIIDRQNFGSAVLALVTGSLSDADATFTTLLEEGNAADMTDAVAVADVDMLGTEVLASFDALADGSCRKLGYVGGKRYLRATVTPANNSGNLFMAGMWILGDARIEPAPNPPV